MSDAGLSLAERMGPRQMIGRHGATAKPAPALVGMLESGWSLRRPASWGAFCFVICSTQESGWYPELLSLTVYFFDGATRIRRRWVPELPGNAQVQCLRHPLPRLDAQSFRKLRAVDDALQTRRIHHIQIL